MPIRVEAHVTGYGGAILRMWDNSRVGWDVALAEPQGDPSRRYPPRQRLPNRRPLLIPKSSYTMWRDWWIQVAVWVAQDDDTLLAYPKTRYRYPQWKHEVTQPQDVLRYLPFRFDLTDWTQEEYEVLLNAALKVRSCRVHLMIIDTMSYQTAKVRKALREAGMGDVMVGELA
ncbi:MAG: hypothetical protein EA402_03290 [Planctomycetota bacterium]|nr:MAG: hypothetical protein EA402_03290 [Planctomycetota bacterium]